jgi:hypothetical protein
MSRPETTVYDSYLVRVWREPETGRLRRVEIEHVQDGAIRTGRAVPAEWILDALGVQLQTVAGSTDGRRSRKEQVNDDEA